MRRTCQVYTPERKLCGEPAVDFAEVSLVHRNDQLLEDTVRVWMCAFHWDEHLQRKKSERNT